MSQDKTDKPIGASAIQPSASSSSRQEGAPLTSAHYRPTHQKITLDNAEIADLTKSKGLTEQAWRDEDERARHQSWNRSIGGRLAVRTLSRGVMGAAFFAVGSHYARETMREFKPGETSYKPLHMVANTIDHVAGRPLEKMFGKEFVTFRPTKYHYGGYGGCTLGHEAVALTFDFASMSVGDAIGRDLAEAADPNVHHSWIDKEGHINYSQIAKNVGKNTFKYITYSQGEDWAVAVPYAFFCRAQRGLIERLSPGFGYDSDRRLNGASYKVNDAGKITGTYGLEGALDLQGRFTAYNIGTLMFREAYVKANKSLKDWYDSGFKLPQGPASMSDAIEGTIGAVGNVSRWAVRDAIKATMYMIPSVPAFWMFRVSQHKYNAAFIHPEKGLISFGSGKNLQAVRVNEISRTTNELRDEMNKFSEQTPTFFSASDSTNKGIDNGPVANPFITYGKKTSSGDIKIDAYEHTYDTYDKIFNPLGAINNAVRKKFHKPIGILEENYVQINHKKLRPKKFTDLFVNASFAYTPYFMMKNDVLAYNLDHGKMDMAIERAIDGASHLNIGELKAGMGEIWAATQFWKSPHGVPFKDPVREVAAQKAICDDESPADGQNYFANSRCYDQALQNISIHSKYHSNVDTKRFVERLQDSKRRSQGLIDNFKQETAQKFTDLVQPRSLQEAAWNAPDPDASFTQKEKQRQIKTLNDFPDIHTTLH